MELTIKEMLDELENHINDETLYDYQERIVDALKKHDDKESYAELIFSTMEKYPLANWGMPGAFVNFLESLNNEIYEKYLIESILRKPTNQTVWMLNRQINSVSVGSREKYLKLLRDIVKNNDIPAEIVDSAKGFIAYQEKVINSSCQKPKENNYNSLEQIFNMFKFIPKE